MKKLFLLLSVIALASTNRIHKPLFAPEITPKYESGISKSLSGRPNRFLRFQQQEYNNFISDNDQIKFAYLSEESQEDPVTIAQKFLMEKLQISEQEYVIMNSYKTESNGVHHIYFKQRIDGIEVENGDANVNIDKNGRVVSYGSSFYQRKPEDVRGFGASLYEKRITPSEAVESLAKYLGLNVDKSEMAIEETVNSLNEEPRVTVTNVPFTVNRQARVEMNFLQVEDGQGGFKLEEVWDVQAEMEENWYHAHIDSVSGKVLQILDWVTDYYDEKEEDDKGLRSKYNVYPLGVNDPEDGDRQIVINPADKEASPEGWHSDGKKQFTVTSGNNVEAQANWGGRLTETQPMQPDGGKSLNFDFDIDFKKDPKDYVEAAVTNLFYWNNVIHDLFYKYGFDEKSGNFQKNNFGRGGKGNDQVIANAQDGSGLNNANFATPPDGQNGRMRMYIWDQSTPRRDGDLESGIIIHEYGHGISTRLTGGPANSGCLGWGEAGGMGEGWGDFFATILRMKSTDDRKTIKSMGAYSMNNKKGIRKYVYSTDMKVNPSTYAFIKKFDYYGVHAKGEVWAVILYEVYWNLVDKHGFSKDWYNIEAKGKDTDSVPAGNIMAMKLIVDGMKLQPCRPSFVDARDAILQADEVNYNSANKCELWKGFAKRGLGQKARSGGMEDFTVPAECQ
ncbi:hypothetical protein MP638_002589 [Amoeboaphelidium occidentale]|nr:hypothetical protein MP638_002589 [Amoeboaphelidium occidentale]